jgi:hypothetical protein
VEDCVKLLVKGKSLDIEPKNLNNVSVGPDVESALDEELKNNAHQEHNSDVYNDKAFRLVELARESA